MTLPSDAIPVLDAGYVRLVDSMGSDLTPANAARVSYNKQKAVFDEKDERLLKFLAEHGHTSPFRHATLQFEVYAPLLVARQWFKHCVGSTHQDSMLAWNEVSHRYTAEATTFYRNVSFRQAPEKGKQGSGDKMGAALQLFYNAELDRTIEAGTALYDLALKDGMAIEQARLFLPAYGLMVRWYWTASLQGVVHFLDLRSGEGAQWEIKEYAKAVRQLTSKKFPVSLQYLLGDNNEATNV